VDIKLDHCRKELQRRNDGIERHSGFLGVFGRNPAELAKVYREPLPSCDRLRQLGYAISGY